MVARVKLSYIAQTGLGLPGTCNVVKEELELFPGNLASTLGYRQAHMAAALALDLPLLHHPASLQLLLST